MTSAVGLVGMGTSLFGSLLGAQGAKQSAQAQSQSYMFQAGVAMLNKQIAEQNANYSSEQGELTAAKYGLGARQTAGHIVAAQGASGLDVNTGSNKNVQDSQHTVSMLDQGTIRMNAAKTAYDYEVQAKQYGLQAMLDMMSSKDAQAAGDTNALSSLIGGAGSVASKWLQGGQSGMFSGLGF